MPSLPAPLAARAERWFGRPATVLAVEDLSPGLVRVSFSGDAWRGRDWVRGQEVEFRVAGRDFRHYTPAEVDPVAGRFDVVFVRHTEGPGTAWVAGLAPGQEVGAMGPGGGIRREPDRRELFLGDATTLGLFAALVPTAGDARGAVEVAAEDLGAAARLAPTLDIVVAGREPGAALATWLDAHLYAVRTGDEAPPERACLAGHTGTITALRRRVRVEFGLARSAVSAKAHWADGRRGL
ncbi:MAG TPA: siderophore-interacting protein [Actinomycetospora sp.]|nr:siderophore-interacting protein [Actinomycetospora sp.]